MRQRLDDEASALPTPDLIDSERSAAAIRRPLPEVGMSDRLRSWIEWFGVARLITSAIAVSVVCVGGWFLVRSPLPPTEATLPMASNAAASSVPLPPAEVPVVATVETESAASGVIVVHVAGAVLAPGVYELVGDARVGDAVERAGGVLADGDPGQLNLAAPVLDGTRIYVPMVGEASLSGAVPTDLVVVASTGSAAPAAGPIDVNSASADELDALPGVGPATAAAIVTERERNGPFATVADLERVPGIGPAKVAALDGLVTT